MGFKCNIIDLAETRFADDIYSLYYIGLYYKVRSAL